jgi:hypothetical protein
MPYDWDGPAVLDTWRERGLDVWRRGIGEWMQGGVPEDFAYEPVLDWSEAHEEFEPRCLDCEVPASAVEIEEAVWCWCVDVTVVQTDERGEDHDVTHRHAHIMSTYLDPRAVEYSHFPLR